MTPRPSAVEPRLNPSTVLAIVIAGPGAWIAAAVGAALCARAHGWL
ncbi:citrate synthase [Methylorubrum rhodinum]|uniref:Citrate synthase n=1 Tax=Methylorubrum rhodinum TaxID=29428 RepID=A0A840ZQ27_9HYPH|nr:citrate synthase [Methylorubrum rhodinum]